MIHFYFSRFSKTDVHTLFKKVENESPSHHKFNVQSWFIENCFTNFLTWRMRGPWSGRLWSLINKSIDGAVVSLLLLRSAFTTSLLPILSEVCGRPAGCQKLHNAISSVLYRSRTRYKEAQAEYAKDKHNKGVNMAPCVDQTCLHDSHR